MQDLPKDILGYSYQSIGKVNEETDRKAMEDQQLTRNSDIKAAGKLDKTRREH